MLWAVFAIKTDLMLLLEAVPEESIIIFPAAVVEFEPKMGFLDLW